jgi:acyl-CoA synthetase (AMP-forming)/AMP-acid ligase II
VGIDLVLEMAASGFGERLAVGARGGGLTYEELDRRSRAGAVALLDSGARHVVYLGANADAFPVALFAGARAGLPFVPLNYRLGDEQLGAVLDALEEPFVIADGRSLPRVAGSAGLVSERDVWLRSTDRGDTASTPPVEDSEIALLLYTSGTSRAPKAAILRHRHLLSYLMGALEFGSAAEHEAALVSVPPYHIAGVTNVLSSCYCGRRIVYLESFTPAGWLEAARAEGITHAMLVPTMLARVVGELNAEGRPDAGLPDLASIAYGGARMPGTIVERALELFPTTGFVNAYGLTETSSTIALLGPEDHRAAVDGAEPAVRVRLQSVGRPLPGVELEIRGPGGEALGPGEPGDLWVRGEQVAGEYAGRPAAGGDGWFATADRARLDEEGYLFIEGRSDDTIIRGGENIAPGEIEDVLARHRAVAEVAVVGLPDEEWGQRIGAVVVLRPDAAASPDELRAWARERLRSSKTPDEVAFWPSLPHTDTGKLLRREVLARLVGADASRTSA